MGAAVIPAIIGAAASIGGSVMNSNAQKNAIAEQNRQQQAAMQRSAKVRRDATAQDEALRAKQQAINEEGLQTQDVNSVSDQLDTTKDDRSAPATAFASNVAALQPGEVAVASRGAGDQQQIVDDDLGTRLAQAAQKTRTAIKAKSDIGAYDALFQNRARDLALSNEQLNQLNKKRQGNLVTAQVENDFVGKPYGIEGIQADTTFGDALSGLGGMFTSYAKGGYG